MPITRTPIHDDDGSGLTGTILDNAWKTELYNQIDGTVPPYSEGSWTPTDASGAGLVLSAASGQFVKIGRLVMAAATFQWPATTNTTPVTLGGLPFISNNNLQAWGGFSTYALGGPILMLLVMANSTTLYVSTGNGRSINSDFSSRAFDIYLSYLAAA
jgi:hypothetical protein